MLVPSPAKSVRYRWRTGNPRPIKIVRGLNATVLGPNLHSKHRIQPDGLACQLDIRERSARCRQTLFFRKKENRAKISAYYRRAWRPRPGLPSGGGRNAASSSTLNNLVVRRLEGCWTCTESRKPRPLSIADFRLLRTYVVLIPNRQRRNIVGLRTNSAQSKRIIVFEETKKVKKTMYLAMKNLSEYIAASGSYEFKNIWEIWALKYNPEEYMIPYLKQMGEQLCQIDKSEINDVPERKYRETIKRMMKPNIDKEELFNGRE